MLILGVYVCPLLKIHNKLFLFENDDFNLVGLLIHLLIAKIIKNILFKKNNGTTRQIVHLRFIFFLIVGNKY